MAIFDATLSASGTVIGFDLKLSYTGGPWPKHRKYENIPDADKSVIFIAC